jgi:hypothetical protein
MHSIKNLRRHRPHAAAPGETPGTEQAMTGRENEDPSATDGGRCGEAALSVGSAQQTHRTQL